MGGRENFEQKENKRGRKILSAVERVHGRVLWQPLITMTNDFTNE